jgi:hypothetical protein
MQLRKERRLYQVHRSIQIQYVQKNVLTKVSSTVVHKKFKAVTFSVISTVNECKKISCISIDKVKKNFIGE